MDRFLILLFCFLLTNCKIREVSETQILYDTHLTSVNIKARNVFISTSFPVNGCISFLNSFNTAKSIDTILVAERTITDIATLYQMEKKLVQLQHSDTLKGYPNIYILCNLSYKDGRTEYLEYSYKRNISYKNKYYIWDDSLFQIVNKYLPSRLFKPPQKN